jgi:predicted Zn-dependent protease with MMP-like domain
VDEPDQGHPIGGPRGSDDPRELRALVELFGARMDAGKYASAERVVEDMAELAGHEDAEVLYARAELAWAEGGPGAALPALLFLVESHPDFVLGHHALGHAYEDRGEFEPMVAHYLEVHRLDELRSAGSEGMTESSLRAVEERVSETLAALPEHLRERVGDLPIMLEARPSRELVETGLDPRLFGLFEGEDQRMSAGAAMERAATMPARVVVFYENLREVFSGVELLDEVEVTVLHELAHFLGLGEEEVADLGLE